MDDIYGGVDVYISRSDLPTRYDAVMVLCEAEVLDPAFDNNNDIFTSDDDKIFIL